MAEKKKSWFKKHLILTIALSIILGMIIMGVISAIIKPGSISGNQQSSFVTSKTSNYTLEDCMNACNNYCLKVQVDTCQTGCSMIGKQGQALDKEVIIIKKTTANLKC